MNATSPLPLNVEAPLEDSTQNKRLWIGNLDQCVTEYHLLKLLQKYGTIEKFDLLFHRSGPQAGQPRGYAFVTFTQREEACRVKKELDGVKFGTKNISIKWAFNNEKEEESKMKQELKIPALAGANEEKKPLSVNTKIQAIEAKLKSMESSSCSELEIFPTLKTSRFSERDRNSRDKTNKRHLDHKNKYKSKPYSRS